jgi:hypothetical protein
MGGPDRSALAGSRRAGPGTGLGYEQGGLQRGAGPRRRRACSVIGALTGAAGNGEDFTTSAATKPESFAAKHGVQELAFWEVDAYDRPLGYAYSRIFNKITS